MILLVSGMVACSQVQYAFTNFAGMPGRGLGSADGLNIFIKRHGDADFIFLARDTVPPYVDNRPLLATPGS